MDSDIATFSEIRASLARLRTTLPCHDVFGAAEHRFYLHPPLTQTNVDTLEARHRITLPSDYRGFLMQVGNGGAGPYYGLFRWGEMDKGHEYAPWHEVPGSIGDLSAPFPHTEAWNDLTGMPDDVENEDNFDEDEYERQMDAFETRYFAPEHIQGAIPLCHRGCGLRDWLVISGPEAGNVWRDDRADHGGLHPLQDDEKSRITFLTWYQTWLNDVSKVL